MGLKEVWKQAVTVDLDDLEKEIHGEKINRGAAFDLFFMRVSAYGPGIEAGVVKCLTDLDELRGDNEEWLFIIIDGRNRRRPLGLMAKMPASGDEEEQECLSLEALKSGVIGVGGMSGVIKCHWSLMERGIWIRGWGFGLYGQRSWQACVW